MPKIPEIDFRCNDLSEKAMENYRQLIGLENEYKGKVMTGE